MRVRNWYCERAQLLQEIAVQQPITTNHIRVRFKTLESEKTVMVIHGDYDNAKERKSRTLYISIISMYIAPRRNTLFYRLILTRSSSFLS